MIYILFFLIINLNLANKYNKRIVEVQPITFSMLVLILYFLAFFNKMWLIDYIVGIGLFTVVLWTILATPKNFEYKRVRNGLIIMLWGFFVKLVIADRAAVLVNTVYGDYQAYSGYQLVIANILFAVQIYSDFMGYSTIAKGAAKVIGYDLTDNFRQPYFAQSIKDFWRRWHISLSLWLRDYLYIPLGGSKCSKRKKYFNIMITFLASGLWHGANGTYVCWGGTRYLSNCRGLMLANSTMV